MPLQVAAALVRSWRAGDAPALARHANSRAVWRNLRDRFPHPYTLADAQAWLTRRVAADPETNFAIEVGGEACGGIGLELLDDVARGSAEIGFWLGERVQGRGIGSAVVPAFTQWALDRFQLHRIHAAVFAWNPTSMRVLEKAGYVREGVLRRSAVKDGQVIDTALYAIVR
jgi:RimJ/RimL family protein N-acetyltransferase